MNISRVQRDANEVPGVVIGVFEVSRAMPEFHFKEIRITRHAETNAIMVGYQQHHQADAQYHYAFADPEALRWPPSCANPEDGSSRR